ncbi:cation transporter [Longimicrobium sp.]|uniref:cation transporter n=1 Tax=Longimicrobium sp. TaxID=2029185 RepID=UPI002E3177C4|nr:cation transporter [Longimicrobium sp.]HEX6037757.1 cation transporter [Longimicrobium sp.]
MKYHVCCIAACIALLPAGAACGGDPAPRQAEAAPNAPPSSPARAPAVPAGLARVEFHVKGMTCAGCEVGTRGVLKKVEGVRDAGASYPTSSAWAVYDPAKASPDEMMAAIRQLGYEPAVVHGGSPAPPAS